MLSAQNDSQVFNMVKANLMNTIELYNTNISILRPNSFLEENIELISIDTNNIGVVGYHSQELITVKIRLSSKVLNRKLNI